MTKVGVLAVASVFCLVGCGDDTTPIADSSVDVDGAPDVGGYEPPAPMPPEPPRLTPCPSGWREAEAEGFATCEPFPSDGPDDCVPGEAHFPGTDGCAPIGSACPTDGWPADLPASGVSYVDPMAPGGGDGTRASPLITIAEALDAAAEGQIIALAAAVHEGPIRPTRSAEVIGACPSETIVRSDSLDVVVSVSDGIELTLRDLSVEAETGTAFLRGGVVNLAGVLTSGVSVLCTGGTLNVDRVEVRDASVTIGPALQLINEGTALVARSLSIRGAASGALSVTMSASADIEDLTVDDAVSYGVSLGADTNVAIRRAFVGEAGIAALSAGGGVFEVSDVVLRAPRSDLRASLGVIVSAGGQLELSRALITDVEGHAMLITDEGSSLTARDVIAHRFADGGTEPRSGRAIEVGVSSRAQIERVAFLGTRGIAMFAVGVGAEIVGTDVLVRDVGSDPSGLFGRGLHAQSSAMVSLSRASLEGCHEAALTAAIDSVVSLVDVSIVGTLERGCVSDTCPGQGAGFGIAVQSRGAVEATRFRIADNALCGIQVADQGGVDLHEGVVEGHTVGANVQSDGFDVDRLTDRVLFRDNDTGLDTRMLVVPDALPP